MINVVSIKKQWNDIDTKWGKVRVHSEVKSLGNFLKDYFDFLEFRSEFFQGKIQGINFQEKSQISQALC